MSANSAAETSAVAGACSSREVLTLSLGKQAYGIDILAVQEIRNFEPPTRIAQAPARVLGVINLRGAIVPIVDLRLEFDLPADITARTATVVLSVHGRVIGVVVDEVSDVMELPAGEIRPSPPLGQRSGPNFVSALATVEHGTSRQLVALLDVDQLFALV